MNRKDILDKAQSIVVNGDRETQYGTPEESFNKIAKLWSIYLGPRVTSLKASDVAAMMALLKIARISGNHYSEDSWIDLAGYAACGGELAFNEETHSGRYSWGLAKEVQRYKDD